MFKRLWPLFWNFITSWYALEIMPIRYRDVHKTSPAFACYFYSWKVIVYTFLFLIMLITLITLGCLNGTFVLNANDIHIKVCLSEHFDILFAFFWVHINLWWMFRRLWPLFWNFITSWYELEIMPIRYRDVHKTSPAFACYFYS